MVFSYEEFALIKNVMLPLIREQRKNIVYERFPFSLQKPNQMVFLSKQ